MLLVLVLLLKLLRGAADVGVQQQWDSHRQELGHRCATVLQQFSEEMEGGTIA